MKGRMRPYLPELTIRDYNTYQWYQRGVRRQLYTTYGLYSCYGLRYNGVLFAVLADSLAGRPAICCAPTGCCLPSCPTVWRGVCPPANGSGCPAHRSGAA